MSGDRKLQQSTDRQPVTSFGSKTVSLTLNSEEPTLISGTPRKTMTSYYGRFLTQNPICKYFSLEMIVFWDAGSISTRLHGVAPQNTTHNHPHRRENLRSYNINHVCTKSNRSKTTRTEISTADVLTREHRTASQSKQHKSDLS